MKLVSSLIQKIIYFIISLENHKKKKNHFHKTIRIFIFFKLLIIQIKKEINHILKNSYQKMLSYGILNKNSFFSLELKVVCRQIWKGFKIANIKKRHRIMYFSIIKLNLMIWVLKSIRIRIFLWKKILNRLLIKLKKTYFSQNLWIEIRTKKFIILLISNY
jgi:hypothetical protein